MNDLLIAFKEVISAFVRDMLNWNTACQVFSIVAIYLIIALYYVFKVHKEEVSKMNITIGYNPLDDILDKLSDIFEIEDNIGPNDNVVTVMERKAKIYEPVVIRIQNDTIERIARNFDQDNSIIASQIRNMKK